MGPFRRMRGQKYGKSLIRKCLLHWHQIHFGCLFHHQFVGCVVTIFNIPIQDGFSDNIFQVSDCFAG
jgi:hypothetical protein